MLKLKGIAEHWSTDYESHRFLKVLRAPSLSSLPVSSGAGLVKLAEYIARRKALLASYPYMFAGPLVGRRLMTHQERLEYAIAIKPGWLHIVEQLCADLDKLVPAELKQPDGSGFYVGQIKEKLGTLCIYCAVAAGRYRSARVDLITTRDALYTFGDDGRARETWRIKVLYLLTGARRRCSETCYVCGGPGRKRKRETGPLETSCDLHAAPEYVDSVNQALRYILVFEMADENPLFFRRKYTRVDIEPIDTYGRLKWQWRHVTALGHTAETSELFDSEKEARAHAQATLGGEWER